jgi:type II secretory pathway predicted ATPase ExeA
MPAEPQYERGSRAEGGPGLSVLGPARPDPRANGLTYEPFYGLREKPFSLTSDSRFFYHSRSHAPAFAELVAGIRRRESLNVLSGDIGTGKTTLCRAVLQNLDRKTFSAFVPDPFASREDLLKVLLVDFGVVSVDDLASGRLKDASRTELSYVLYQFVGTLSQMQAFAVVIIDEAQNLSIPLLEEVRILSDADGLLQVILVGQLELREKLKLPEMRPVDQRVSVHCTLEPLGVEGVAGYIDHRLYAAGGTPDRIKFSDDAVEAIYRLSGGVPRIVNRLCDRALQNGYLRRVGTIDRAIIDASTPDVIAAPRVIPSRSFVPAPPPVAVPPPSSDLLDSWLSGLDGGASTARATSPAPATTAGLMRPDRLDPAAPKQSAAFEAPPDPLPGFLLRPETLRTPIQLITDRWLRGVGIATFAIVGLGVVLLGAPTMLEIANALVKSAVSVVAAPESLKQLPAPALRTAPALVVPATPDISADVTSAVGQIAPAAAGVPR